MTYIRWVERRIRKRLVRVVQFHEFYFNRNRMDPDGESSRPSNLQGQHVGGLQHYKHELALPVIKINNAHQ